MSKEEGTIDQFSISDGIMKWRVNEGRWGWLSNRVFLYDLKSLDNITLMTIQVEITRILMRMENVEELPSFHDVRDKLKSISEESKP